MALNYIYVLMESSCQESNWFTSLAFRNPSLLWLASLFLYMLHAKVQYLILCRYERRFSELNVCIQVRMIYLIFTLLLYRFVYLQAYYWLKNLYVQQEKLQQTRKLYGTYNALLEIKDLMLKEISLLNSIGSQVKHMHYCLATFCVFASNLLRYTFRYQVDLRFCFLLLVYIYLGVPFLPFFFVNPWLECSFKTWLVLLLAVWS